MTCHVHVSADDNDVVIAIVACCSPSLEISLQSLGGLQVEVLGFKYGRNCREGLCLGQPRGLEAYAF